jgi:(2Fe-2S) ferredoxin/predicted methyltransferase
VADDGDRTGQRRVAESIGVPEARRHIFLCCDQTKPKCCDEERGLRAWDYLKARLQELGLSGRGGILRTKANCLRICTGGPIAVVYPEGAWYGACDPPVLEQIVQHHLVGGRVVEEHLITRHALGDSLDMKRDWDERARQHAEHFIATSHDQSEEVFRAQGARDSQLLFEGLEFCLGPGCEVVDVGCGIGRMDEFVAPRAAHLTGVDVSGEMVRKATARLRHLPNVRFVECDGYSLPLPAGSADTTFSHIVFQHMPRHVVRGYFREVFRVLRPGGNFVFQMPEWNPQAPADPPGHDTFEMRFWKESELRQDLEAAGFRWGSVRRFRVETPELVFDQLRVHAQKPA